MTDATVAPRAEAAPRDDERESDDLERRLGRVLPRAMPVVVLVAAIAVGLAVDFGAALLVVAGGVLLGVVALLWASLRTLTGDAPITIDEALALGHPSAAVEQKRAILQALKDLEYERSVGKIDEADYQELSQRYRAEAKRLLRALDDDLGPMRARAEAYAAERLGTAKRPAAAAKERARRACEACATPNDDDARFCKRCGATLEATTHSATLEATTQTAKSVSETAKGGEGDATA